jgi:hypothetical protein
MAGTGITDMDTPLRSARGVTTITILTLALPTDTTDRAGLSAASSSALVPGTTDTGVAAMAADMVTVVRATAMAGAVTATVEAEQVMVGVE